MNPVKTNITNVGPSLFFHIPKAIVDLFNFFKRDENYEWDMEIKEDEKKVILTRVEKEEDKKEQENSI